MFSPKFSFFFFFFFNFELKKCRYRQISFREALFYLHPTHSISTLLKPMFSSKIFWTFLLHLPLSPNSPANSYRVLKINLLKILKAIVFSDLCWPLIWAKHYLCLKQFLKLLVLIFPLEISIQGTSSPSTFSHFFSFLQW
mgnify:CR=1 FL=1